MPTRSRSTLSPLSDDAVLSSRSKRQKKSGSSTNGSSGTLPKSSSSAKKSTPSDEFQQVSQQPFVDDYRIVGLGYGGDVYYQPDFISGELADRWYEEIAQLDTYQPMLKMYGRSFPQSRHIAAYSNSPNATLKYSGTDVVMHHPFPPALAEMQARLEDALGVKFNHCMLNRYENGGVYIGKHSDNLNNLVIASISLGAERTFILSPRLPAKSSQTAKNLSDVEMEGLQGRVNRKWKLANGSLVVMQGQTQEFWKHEIPKEAAVKTQRISLTFRQLV